jgi:hypothetical protein
VARETMAPQDSPEGVVNFTATHRNLQLALPLPIAIPFPPTVAGELQSTYEPYLLKWLHACRHCFRGWSGFHFFFFF